MSAYPSDRPEPVQTRVRRFPSGQSHVTLLLHEDHASDCHRCPCERCERKLKVADPDLGLLTCTSRMPSSAVGEFLFGPAPANAEPVVDPDPAPTTNEWPTHASVAFIDILGRNAVLFAWSDLAWSLEIHKPDAWAVRDGRLLIVPIPDGPSPPIEVTPWAGRSDRFCVAPSLDIEVNLSGLLAIYTVTPRPDDNANPSSQAVPLAGDGGVRWADVTHRADLFKSLNGFPD
jgi:hypothetical protein